ncbi:MAG: SDR family oxidoreductase [Alphaproteobacteria bacterium]|nr:SDR family oxidoreductase [Alphaproteobacteria bacterium]
MKTVLITGASSSIGRPLTQQLVDQGYRVLAHFRRPHNELLELKSSYGEDLHLLNADLGSGEDVNNFIESLAKFEPLFAIIHLPSPQISLKPLPRIDWPEFQDHLNIQLKSLQQIVQASIKPMKKAGEGFIISIGSDAIATKDTPKGFTAYAVAKAALRQFLKCLEAEYQESSINVHQITPKMFKSPLLDELPDYVIEQTLSQQSDRGGVSYQEEIATIICDLLSGNSDKSHDIEI